MNGDGMFSIRVCDLCPTPAACQEDVVENRCRLDRLGRGQNAPPWEFTFGQLHLEIDDHADAIDAAGFQDDDSQRVEEFIDTRRYMFWALAECIESKRRNGIYREAGEEPQVIPMPPTYARWRESNERLRVSRRRDLDDDGLVDSYGQVWDGLAVSSSDSGW